MKRKPTGLKYRNLHARGGSIIYERILNGKRIKRSLGVDDWNEAAATRDALERQLGVGGPMLRIECPTFAEAAASHLEQLSHLAATSADDDHAMLGAEKVEDGQVVKPAGPLVARFGAMRLDAIRRVHLLDWWAEFIEKGGGSAKTGRNYLNALSGVFVWGMERELLDDNPAEGLRAVLRRRNRTKQGRAENEAGAKAQPIEQPEHVAALVAAAAAVGGKPYLVTLLALDAGLRLGEATALDWADVDWDRPALRVRQSLSRGKHLGKTKSGRERTVQLSKRLRLALMEAWLAAGRPEAGAVARVDHANYRNRTLRDLCKVAGIEKVGPHHLRDTFASQLLSAGVQLAYVSHQLGHADVAVTARSYARWCGGDAYRRPLEVAEGEVPADLLARLGEPSHQSPTAAAGA